MGNAMDERKIKYIKLMDFERYAYKEMEPITFGSIYETDGSSEYSVSSVLGSLKERAAEILKKNPWLGGRLVSNRNTGKELQLKYSYNIDDVENYVQCLTNDEFFESDLLDAKTPICTYLPPISGRCINKDEVLCKFLIIQNQAQSKLALVLSLDHTIADGYVAYNIWKMWDMKSNVHELQVERVHEFPSIVKQETCLTPDTSITKYLVPLMFRGIWRSIRRKPPPTYHMYSIDPEIVARIKSKYADVDLFVSTNDVVNTSIFGSDICSKDNVTFMEVGARNRVSSISDNMVGNYHAYAQFRSPDLENPKRFRESWKAQLSEQSSGEKQFFPPGSLNFSTNWATFYHQIDLAGLKHTYHIPLISLEYPQLFGIPFCPECALVLFKINSDKYAVHLLLYGDVTEEVLEKCEIFEKKI